MGNMRRHQRLSLLVLLGFCVCLHTPQVFAVTYGNSTPVNIPDNDPIGTTSTLVVTDSMSIADMNVTVNLTHGWIADVVLTLTHDDSGHSAILAQQIGVNAASGDELGCGLNDMHVVFDEEIAQSEVSVCQNLSSFAFGVDGTLDYTIEDFADEATYLTACVAVEYQCNAAGEYAVQGAVVPNDGLDSGLTEFYGEDMLGTWTLTVSDNVSTDTGELTDWSLTFADTNCGNGNIEGTEACDDGNSFANDGCSAFCELSTDNDEDTYFTDTDCDDTNADIHPDAVEICDDEVDNNCDGNELSPSTWYSDVDIDGFGVTAESVESCEAIDFYVTASGDCDDNNSDIFPTQVEIIDDIDNNCDGNIDEDTTESDDDGDSFSEDAGDCDDTNDTVYPDATEGCDTIDNNCDDVVDEGCDAEDPEEEPAEEGSEEENTDEENGDDDATDETEDEVSDDAAGDDDTDAADTSNPNAEAERLQTWARNPLRSDVVAGGCSLQMQNLPQNTSPWTVVLALNLILITLGFYRVRARRAVPLQGTTTSFDTHKNL